MKDLSDFLRGLDRVRSCGDNYTAACPAHDDGQNSLSIFQGKDGRWHLHCHAGCAFAAILSAARVETKEWGEIAGKGEPNNRPKRDTLRQSLARATAVRWSDGVYRSPYGERPKETGPRGLTRAQYAEAKRLDERMLFEWRILERDRGGYPALTMPYYDIDGAQVALRWRIALKGDRFRWDTGAATCLYGLWRLPDLPAAAFVALVEGESDCHTMWNAEIPAMGVPGASIWKDDENCAALADFFVVVAIEPDRGGETLLNLLAKSKMASRIFRADMGQYGVKDVSELYLQSADTAQFRRRWQGIVQGAIRQGAIV